MVDSRENEEQAIEGMETEEEGENGGLFSTPQRGNSPQQQGESQAEVPSVSTFLLLPTYLPNRFLFCQQKAPEAPLLPQHSKLNL